MKIILLAILTLLFACKQSPKPDKDFVDTTITENIQRTDDVKETFNTKSVSTIVTFIDSLYELKGLQTLDTITDWIVSGNQEYELGPKGLDLTNLDKYYRFVSFHFLLFKNKTAAKKQFDRIVEVGSYEQIDRSNTNQSLYWKIFSKAGSAYTLYENMIIYHDRRCNYNEKIEVPREDKLLDYLFEIKPPNNTYFIRVKCGWGQSEKK